MDLLFVQALIYLIRVSREYSLIAFTTMPLCFRNALHPWIVECCYTIGLVPCRTLQERVWVTHFLASQLLVVHRTKLTIRTGLLTFVDPSHLQCPHAVWLSIKNQAYGSAFCTSSAMWLRHMSIVDDDARGCRRSNIDDFVALLKQDLWILPVILRLCVKQGASEFIRSNKRWIWIS